MTKKSIHVGAVPELPRSLAGLACRGVSFVRVPIPRGYCPTDMDWGALNINGDFAILAAARVCGVQGWLRLGGCSAARKAGQFVGVTKHMSRAKSVDGHFGTSTRHEVV
jgi:hypothetical protein